jgi:hypothetical protein
LIIFVKGFSTITKTHFKTRQYSFNVMLCRSCFSGAGYKFVRDDDYYIGSKYKKAVYTEYTNETFKQQKLRGPRDVHLGIMGPYVRAEVGDVIRVVFLNRAPRPYSIKPHGVLYDKANEGSQYADNSPFRLDNGVLPGNSYTYHWTVPERSGPGPHGCNCIAWNYNSGIDD